MKHYFLLSAALLMTVPAISADTSKETPELLPATPWKIDFDDAGCSIERRFTLGEGDVSVRMLRRGVTGGVDILLVGSLIPRSNKAVNPDIKLMPQGRSVQFRALPGKVSDSENRYLRGFATNFTTHHDWVEDQQVRITDGQKLDLNMQWPGAKSAFAVLQNCDDDFFAEQGIDMAALRSQTAQPKRIPNVAPKSSSSDYPSKAKVDEQVGSVIYELKIDETGAVVGCQNMWADGVSDASRPCEYTRKDKYTPATNAEGKPAVGYVSDAVAIRVTVTSSPM